MFIVFVYILNIFNTSNYPFKKNYRFKFELNFKSSVLGSRACLERHLNDSELSDLTNWKSRQIGDFSICEFR